MHCLGNPISRRGFLTAGTIGGLGISLPQLMWMEQAAAAQKHYDFIEAKAKSVIHVYLRGHGPPGKLGSEALQPAGVSRWDEAGEDQHRRDLL